MSIADFDLQKFLDTPIEAFDFKFMIGDVKDFLEFSESNLDWQYRRELQAIAHGKDFDDFPPGYRHHLEQNAEHRFKVSLPLRVRYGAVLAFTTSVEWAIAYLNQCAVSPVPALKYRTNLTVKILRDFSARASVDAGAVIDDYEALVKIRNCIAHSAGIVESYRYKIDLPAAISRIDGITLANWHLFGDQVCIEKGALEPHIDRAAELVVSLHSALRERGLLK
ncbi:hypothetical protein [Accumulibacter sp.]|uniref:hypothetical protein n=1 Tax=Accumulibacter sp. TaxID=2053492 RepID=UPI0028C3CA34|nr:hypothetical protein [Accumulibacter sp.]